MCPSLPLNMSVQAFTRHNSTNNQANRQTHLHPARLDPRLVAELDQSHQHGQPQPADQDVEDSRHVAQTERARLVLSAQIGGQEGPVVAHRVTTSSQFSG